MSQPINVRAYEGIKESATSLDPVQDALTIEQPLAIAINDEPFTLTMQTPGDELDLAYGLLLTEGVFKKGAALPPIDIKEKSAEGFISGLNVRIEASALRDVQLNKRSLLSVASCGICGKTELDLPKGRVEAASSRPDIATIDRMFEIMQAGQSAFLSSGGCHAAAAFNASFELMVLREDIGRHNAVDKVIGALLTQGKLSDARFLLVSGRVSYEIVVKCFMAGIPALLAVSAPSSLAVDFCKELGITLYGFCRPGRATCYSAP
ncbi:MAG: formate dehydrogenase accessory sulfurtransferase FdhD [Flavobacteriales bacterium]|jgi:FdhD protein